MNQYVCGMWAANLWFSVDHFYINSEHVAHRTPILLTIVEGIALGIVNVIFLEDDKRPLEGLLNSH